MYIWGMPDHSHKAIVLFDGVCKFCNTTVNTIIKNDKKAYIKFAPLQSTIGKQLMEKYHLDLSKIDSVIFIENGRAYIYSGAILHIARRLGGLYPLMYAFILIPSFIRNPIYKWIAKNRYKWFGKNDSCMIPTPEVKDRFIG